MYCAYIYVFNTWHYKKFIQLFKIRICQHTHFTFLFFFIQSQICISCVFQTEKIAADFLITWQCWIKLIQCSRTTSSFVWTVEFRYTNFSSEVWLKWMCLLGTWKYYLFTFMSWCTPFELGYNDFWTLFFASSSFDE